MSNIKFGTDGWRAVVGKDFNEENVKKFAQKVHDMIQNEINASGGSNAFNKGHMERLKGINK